MVIFRPRGTTATGRSVRPGLRRSAVDDTQERLTSYAPTGDPVRTQRGLETPGFRAYLGPVQPTP
jgi:hypothetical protein